MSERLQDLDRAPLSEVLESLDDIAELMKRQQFGDIVALYGTHGLSLLLDKLKELHLYWN